MKSLSRNVSMLVALTASVLMATACKSTTVRGPDGQAVTATTTRSITIRRGETALLDVAIDRKNFNGPVKVSISQLPKGVDADRSVINTEATGATFGLKASPSADLVKNQAVLITIEDPSGRQAQQSVSLTVIQ